MVTASRRRAGVPKGDESTPEVPKSPNSEAPKSRRFFFSLNVAARLTASLLFLYIMNRILRVEEATFPAVAEQSDTVDITAPHQVKTGVPEYDEAFALALREIKENTVKGAFIAGQGWSQLWTRDTAYAVELSANLVDPAASKISLQKCITKLPDGPTWLQDSCGHFGQWPNLSDAIVGAQGAWALYLSTGDRPFLEWAYSVTKRALKRAEDVVYDGALFRGCSSFMESNSGYPQSYRQDGLGVGKTKALSTNVLHYNGYKYAAMMGQELGAPSEEIDAYTVQGHKLKAAIRSRFWLPDKGYYAYFEDANKKLVSQMEGLGESLILLAPDLETNKSRIDSIFANTPRTKAGLACLWPRFELNDSPRDIFSYYHNGRIWPFVQGYWAVAAARHGKVAVFQEEFHNLVKLSERGKTFAEFYELDGSFPQERRRQLWSSAGFVGMVYYGLFGLELQPKGIAFRPVKPSPGFAETVSLINLPYRKAKLTIHLSGSGAVIDSFKRNGSPQQPFIPSDVNGAQLIEIKLKEVL